MAVAISMYGHSCDVLSFAKHVPFSAVLWVVLASVSTLVKYTCHMLHSCVHICAGLCYACSGRLALHSLNVLCEVIWT